MAKQLIFDTIQNRTKKNQFLLTNSFDSEYFSGTDTKELYERSLLEQPNNWFYRNNPVRYTLNSWGYRTKEFKHIDWANSVVLFGDSYVFGIGVDDKETISYQLEQIIGLPVINMGVGGTSMCYSLNNSSILRDGYPTPKAIVHLWTNYDRTTFYHKRTLVTCGAWNVGDFAFTREFTSDVHHGMTNALFIAKISRWLWKDTKYFEASYFEETSKLLKCHYLKTVDKARDLIHAGKDSHLRTAKKIAKELNL